MPPLKDLPTPPSSVKQLFEGNWSKDFESLMKNRMAMGSLRYGNMFRQDLASYHLPEEAIRRIRQYVTSGNTEHLVDAANICLLAFVGDNHPEKHFKAIDDGQHSKQK